MVSAVVLLLISLLTGCSRTIFFDQPILLKTQSQKLTVNLHPSLQELKQEPLKRRVATTGVTLIGQGLIQDTYHIGPALKYYFEHDPNSSVLVSYVSSDGDNSVVFRGQMDFIAGRVYENYAIYKLVVQVLFKGDSHTIEAKGNALSKEYNEAAQQAVEAAVIDLYNKISALLKEGFS